ncbi:right-handed parallel beta-helix repeat-containing protein [Paenibacillus ferrarius]|uniref:right-handed parallel beta-helix repeat-containing protein n=1 Tax=Paenibacillus ferrarius TaxID=1469647 RepID=UPI003D26C220
MKRVSFVFSVVLAMAFLLIAIGIIHGTEVHAAATTFYVSTTGSNSNPGTQSLPFATIQKGVDAAGVAGPGSTVLVRGGTYHVTSPINITASGASGSPITIKAYTGEIPIISVRTRIPAMRYKTTRIRDRRLPTMA